MYMYNYSDFLIMGMCNCVCATVQVLMMKHYSVLELPSLVIEMNKGDHHVVSG